MNLYEQGYTQNREISWLRYDDRVLDEALDPTVPLFERLKYISIFISNLEEFMQVRVGGLIVDYKDGEIEKDIRSGLTPKEQLDAIYEMLPDMLAKKDKIYEYLDEELSKAGLHRVDADELTGSELSRVSGFFRQKIYKHLRKTVVSVDQPLPYINENKAYLICSLRSETDACFGVIDIPSSLPTIFVLEDGTALGREMKYILVEDIIKLHARFLFEPFIVEECVCFDIARSAEVELGEDTGDQLEEMKRVVEERLVAPPDKLIVTPDISEEMLAYLMRSFKLKSAQVLFTNRIDLRYIDELEDHIPYWLLDKLCYKPFKPFNQLLLGYGSVIDRVQSGEILSAYPYDSMDPLLTLLKEAITDSRVKEIRMTIYRLAAQPEIVSSLIAAANNGKTVRVLMELRARFDEAHNIDWSEKLEEAGVKVYFGDEDFKVHSKMCQLVLNDGRYISQVSTGNYNEKTAKKYTDLSLISYDQRLGEDVNILFGIMLENEDDELWNSNTNKDKGNKSKKASAKKSKKNSDNSSKKHSIKKKRKLIANEMRECKHLLASPGTMHEGLIELIRREADKGAAGQIIIKCNSITDEKLIEELMMASCKGCRIRLIVRGICCILPGIPYLTENIQVVNVIGRLLEHSRVFIFGEGSDEFMYISSADLMTRNMEKRVEIACPIYGRQARDRIMHIIHLCYADNVKGRVMLSDGSYARKRIKGQRIDSQMLLMKENTV